MAVVVSDVFGQDDFEVSTAEDQHPVEALTADRSELMDAAMRIAEKIAGNSPTAVQAVKWSARTGQGQPLKHAISVMMEAHWRSAIHPDRVEGIGAFNGEREPIFVDPDY